MRPLGTNQSRSKIENQRMIQRVVFATGPVSRARLAEISGLTEASVSLITSKLLEEGILEEIPEPQERMLPPKKGRKRKLLTISKDYAYFIGIDIGPYRSVLCLMNLDGEMLRKRTIEKEVLSYEDIRKTAVEEGRAFLDKLSPAERSLLMGIGLAVPGRVSLTEGRIIDDRYEVPEMPLSEEIEAALGYPVSLVNNVKARAIDHSLYHITGPNRGFIYFFLGYGANCQYVTYDSQGKVMLPGDGEIGHSFIGGEGVSCPQCGKASCLESFASEPALLKQVKALGTVSEGKTLSFATLLKYIESDEALPEAEAVFRKAMDKTAQLTGILYSFISPEHVYFSGRVFAGSKCRKWLKEALETYVFRADKIADKVFFPESAPTDGARGAASTALLQQYLRQQ